MAGRSKGWHEGPTVDERFEACERAARAGGRVLQDWVGRFAVREKGPADLVTEADLASQQAVRDILMADFPGHAFVGEEADGPYDPQAENCWVVDPLDGTTNYVHQLPHYAVSIALVQCGQTELGVIYDPVHDECFAAQRGRGAWLNGRPIHVSGAEELSQALVAASFSAKVSAGSPEIAQFEAALLACQAVRRTGSAALNLAYVAAGRFDAFWAVSTKAWDVAAGVLLVREAGGVVTHYRGKHFDLEQPHPAAAATRKLNERFVKLLRDDTPPKEPRLGARENLGTSPTNSGMEGPAG